MRGQTTATKHVDGHGQVDQSPQQDRTGSADSAEGSPRSKPSANAENPGPTVDAEMVEPQVRIKILSEYFCTCDCDLGCPGGCSE